jgi:hypothetical protein
MNDTTLAGALITSPTTAFTELRERPRFLWPFLLVVLSAAGLIFWYYQSVDFEWLKDHMFGDNPAFKNMDDATRERAMGAMSRNTLAYSSLAGVLVMVPVFFLLQTVYFMLGGKITNIQYSFKHWFSLTAWSSLPSLATTVAGVIVMLMSGSNAQLGPSELQVFSLNELWLQLKPADPGYSLATSVNLITFWCCALSIIGVKTWSTKSWTFSAVFVLLPFVLIYGIWAYLAFG